MTESGCSFKDALAEAQEKGYAEADPTSDVDGFDALYKLRILSSLAYKVNLPENEISREGIRGIEIADISFANELGYVIKLLAVSKFDGRKIVARVAPTLVNKNHMLAGVSDAFNAVFLEGETVGPLMFYGKGAGKLPTGSAVVADVVSITKKIIENSKFDEGSNIKDNPSPNPIPDTNLESSADSKDLFEKIKDENSSEYFMRIDLGDSQDNLAIVKGILAIYGIGVLQHIKRKDTNDNETLAFITNKVFERNMEEAKKELYKFFNKKQEISAIRVENFNV